MNLRRLHLLCAPLANIRVRPAALCLLSTALLLSACSIIPQPKADPTRHYILTAPDAPTPAVANTNATSAKKPSIALHAIDTPAYLRATKNIAVRRGPNEIIYHDFARWAETIDDGVARIVSQRLMATNAASNVALRTGGMNRDYDVAIRIIQCEGSIPADGSGASARFTAEYQITVPGNSGAPVNHTFTAAPANWDGKNFSTLATLLGQAASDLADDVASNLPAK